MATLSNDLVAPVTLHDWAVQSNSPMVRAVVQALYFAGTPMTDIPWTTDPSFVTNIARVVTTPTPTHIRLNDPPTSVNVQVERDQEQTYILSNNIDYDHLLNEEKNVIGGPGKLIASKVDAYLKGIAYQFAGNFINNSPVAAYSSFTNDPLAITGLRYRLDNPSTFKVNSEMKINGGGVDLSIAGISAASANRFLELLETLINYMDSTDGEGIVVYMPEDLIRRMNFAIRTLGIAGFGFEKNVYDMSVMTYKSAKVKSIGRVAPSVSGAQTGRVISITEDINGNDGGTQYTSIYAARYGDDYLFGKQFKPLVSYNAGLMNDQRTMRWFFEWVYGLVMQGPRSFGRIYGIKIGA